MPLAVSKGEFVRLIWLADTLRAAGLTVVEVTGWKTRGGETFEPIGVTWHATAGSRMSTALGEVNVILNGSATAPPPIAQLMIYRDGVVYVCAAGRCNHNKVGWDGPNKGLGNTQLLGIEMANDNRGEPWPPAQLTAARRATAAIFKRFGTDPMKRLAAHYEHQPYATRPPGETSTKSDPFGVVMTEERPRVAAILAGKEDDVTQAEFIAFMRAAVKDAAVVNELRKAAVTYMGGPFPAGYNVLRVMEETRANVLALSEADADVDTAAILARIDEQAAALTVEVNEVRGEVIADLGALEGPGLVDALGGSENAARLRDALNAALASG